MALSGFRKRPKLCGTFAKVSTKLSHATSYRHLNLLTKLLLTKTKTETKTKTQFIDKVLLTKTKTKTKFFIDQDKDTVY